jgi:hypothetical protein
MKEQQFETWIKKTEALFQQKENEDNWNLLNDALASFPRYLISEISKYPYFHSIKRLKQGLIVSLLSERTRLSGTACEFLGII